MMKFKCKLYLTVLCFDMLNVTKSGKCLDGTVYNGSCLMTGWMQLVAVQVSAMSSIKCQGGAALSLV